MLLKFLTGTLIYPGGIIAFLLGVFLEGLRRKISARMQLRIGPPIIQPLIDLVKLLNKETLKPQGSSSFICILLPFLGTLALLLCFPFIVTPYSKYFLFSYDLIFILYLTEIPLISQIVFGFYTRSPYGMIGSSRALQMLFCYNLGFISILVTFAFLVTPFSSFCLKEIAEKTWYFYAVLIKLFSLPVFIFSVIAKLKFNPFSFPEAEGEILEGPLTEASGFVLFLFKLNYLLELSIFSYLFTLFYLPVFIFPSFLGNIIFFIGCGMFIFILTFIENMTARTRLNQFFSFFIKKVIPYSFILVSLAWIGKNLV